MDYIQTPEGYLIVNTPENIQKYKNTLELQKHNLKLALKPPFVNMPAKIDKDNYSVNIILDNKNINNISFFRLKANHSMENHWHQNNYHYILVLKGKLFYYEKEISNKGVCLDQVEAGKLLFIPAKTEHKLTSIDDTDFYMFSHKSILDSSDVIESEFDLSKLPIISRQSNSNHSDFIKRY